MANVRSEYTIALKDEFSRGLNSFRDKLNSTKISIANIAAGVGAAGLAFAALIKHNATLADEMGKSAQRAGVTVESFSALSYGAKLADVDIGELEGGLGKLGKSMAQAAQGSKASAAAFASIGVAFKNVDGSLRGTDAVFADVAEKLSKMQDGAAKTALAMQLFGRAGAQLIPLLNGGKEGIQQFTAEARRMGVIVSTETARAAEEFNDNLTRMNSAISGASIALTKELIGGLANLTTEFIRAYTEGEGLLRVLTALGTASSRTFQGNDQRTLGKLLNEQIALEQKLAELRSKPSSVRGSPVPHQIREAQKELDRINAQIEGLKVVIPPAQQGAAPAIVPPKAAINPILENVAATEAAAKKAQQATERLQKAERDYVVDLQKRIAYQHDSSELAQAIAEIESGAAQQFSAATKERIKALSSELDLLQDTKDVHEYLIGLERDRRQEADRATQAVNQERQRTLESLRTPEQAYAAEIKRLMGLGIGGEELQRGIEKARDAMIATREKADETADAAERMGLAFTSAFSKAITGGEGFKEVIKGLLVDIAQIGLAKTIIEPGSKMIEGFFSKGGGGSNFLSGIGDFFGGLFKNDKGGLYRVGGSAGEHPVALSARAGEMVAVGSGGGGGVNIVVQNFGAQVQQRDRGMVNGRRQIELIVRSSMGDIISNGAGRGMGLAPPVTAR